MKTLANEDTNCLVEEKTFKEAMTKREDTVISGQMGDAKEASLRLVSMLKDSQSVYAQLMVAELALFELDQHIKCWQILSRLRLRTSCYNILSRILISKL